MNKGLVIALLAGLVLWAISKGKAGASFILGGTVSPLTDTRLTPAQALAKSNEYLDTVAANYADDPGLVNQISQAKASIAADVAQGISPAEDPGAAIFQGQIDAYAAYRKDGGTLTFNQFSSAIPYDENDAAAGYTGVVIAEKYRDIVKTQESAAFSREVSEIEASMPLGNLKIYTLNQQSGALYDELIRRHPEFLTGTKQETQSQLVQVPLLMQGDYAPIPQIILGSQVAVPGAVAAPVGFSAEQIAYAHLIGYYPG
jgi:hypothetical protein